MISELLTAIGPEILMSAEPMTANIDRISNNGSTTVLLIEYI